MASPAGFRAVYGSGPLHLVAMLVCFTLVGYVVTVVGFTALWNPEVWWQSMLVWFLGAVLLHDLVLFPVYALADRAARKGLGETADRGRRRVPVLNYVRVPALAVGLLFLLFFPGIFEQGAASYASATGQTQEPFLERFLVLSAGIVGISAGAYVLSWARARRREEDGPDQSDQWSASND